MYIELSTQISSSQCAYPKIHHLLLIFLRSRGSIASLSIVGGTVPKAFTPSHTACVEVASRDEVVPLTIYTHTYMQPCICILLAILSAPVRAHSSAMVGILRQVAHLCHTPAAHLGLQILPMAPRYDYNALDDRLKGAWEC